MRAPRFRDVEEVTRMRLRAAVAKRGWSHAETARRTGLNKTTVTRLLAPHGRRITVETLARFSCAFEETLVVSVNGTARATALG